MQEIRCCKCNKKLGMIEGKYEIKCPRCGQVNHNVDLPKPVFPLIEETYKK